MLTGSISNLDDAEPTCNKTARTRKVISGVVGAASSVTSVQVANLLRLFKIPQVCLFINSNICMSASFFLTQITLDLTEVKTEATKKGRVT